MLVQSQRIIFRPTSKDTGPLTGGESSTSRLEWSWRLELEASQGFCAPTCSPLVIFRRVWQLLCILPSHNIGYRIEKLRRQWGHFTYPSSFAVAMRTPRVSAATSASAYFSARSRLESSIMAFHSDTTHSCPHS